MKKCVEDESDSFFGAISDGPRIYTLLDELSQSATKQINTVFDRKPHLQGVTFVQFIKESQITTALNTLDKVFIPLCEKEFEREKFDAIIHDSGLQLLRDIAW